MVVVSEALYGPVWKAQLARDLSWSVESCIMIHKGQRAVPRRLWAPLVAIVERRVTLLSFLLAQPWPRPHQTKHAFLAVLGVHLYGAKWKKPMAYDLWTRLPGLFVNESDDAGIERRGLVDVTEPDRKLGRMATGSFLIPDPMWPALHEIMEERVTVLKSMLPQIWKRAAASL